MGPPKAVRTVSQEAFDEMVKENMEDLGMDATEALEDAIQTLTLQGVDLSGIVTCVPGVSSVNDNPVIQTIERLKQLDLELASSVENDGVLKEIVELLDRLNDSCTDKGSGNVAIATRNGGVQLVCSVLLKLPSACNQGVISSLKTVASLLHDLQSTEMFRESGGPKAVVGILKDKSEDVNILDNGFSVVAAAATGNEVLKASFMDLKIDELIVQCLREHSSGSIPCLYDAIRVLLTSDDNRVVASQVFGYARRFAKIGIAEALVGSLNQGIRTPSLMSACNALKAIAVNDEICRGVADIGGIDAILCCIDESGQQGNNALAKTCCSLLSKLAGSDVNKGAIVEKRGMERLIKISTLFSDDPSVLQEIMSIICVLSLRSPDKAARAIEAGAGDLAIHAMNRFPESEQLQRSACFMIRNLVVRNPENRALLLGNGIEKLIRKAKSNHRSCKDAATDALRDLGLDDYNS
nr:armadillo repeat-containing protein 6 [Ipomoea trifida]